MSRQPRIPPLRKPRPPSILGDLIATRESAPPASTAPRAARTPAGPSMPAAAAAPAAGAEQRSLFGEILDWMLAPLLLLWPLSIALTFVVARSLADAPFDRALVDHAIVLLQQVQVVGERAVIPRSQRLRELLPPGSEETMFYQVLTADGELLAGDPSLPPPSLYDFPAPGEIKKRSETFRGSEVRIAYTHLNAPDDNSDSSFPVLIQIAETVDARTALANEIIKGVIFPQFLILPVAVVLVWIALGRGLSPLKALQDRLRERRPDDLSPIDRRGAPEELAPLVDAFNDLLSRLDANVAAQKRFIADAAHQIKTPLAGLRTHAELALRETDPAELQRRLEQIAVSSGRTAHLVSQLLSLARMENLRDATRLESIDLAPLARAVTGEWVPQALQRRIDLGFESDDAPAPIAGQPMLLREMLNNLIDNALRYTPEDGAVTVRLSVDAGEVAIEVEDTGPGIPAAERELVFERFYRVLGTGTDGSGLGLPIVREIVEQHGATITIDEGDGDGDRRAGTRVTIRFPALDRPGEPWAAA